MPQAFRRGDARLSAIALLFHCVFLLRVFPVFTPIIVRKMSAMGKKVKGKGKICENYKILVGFLWKITLTTLEEQQKKQGFIYFEGGGENKHAERKRSI